uniref:Uncharacterized protein n=1 Tax=Romanomermis culicivorax TaxID=13658 RepID=A0A915KC56_ROMCU
ADGKYQVTIATKAAIHYSGRVRWEPPAIYKSMCQIDVEWFPFDDQVCSMKFGSWSYDGQELDLIHEFFEEHEEDQPIYKYTNGNITVECLENGIDLSRYYSSTEWDIIAVPSVKKHEKYPCCPNMYIDITYHLHLRRKPLFYAVNLIFPCMGMSFLTTAVFYLPSSSGEKVTLCISILVSLTVFFLLLVEIIPSTSLVVPLMAKYLLFTMVTITVAIAVTVVVINVHFRSHRIHSLSKRARKLLLESKLARYLLLDDPKQLLGSPVKNLSFSSKKPNFRADRSDTLVVQSPVQFFNCNFEEFLSSTTPVKNPTRKKARIGPKFSVNRNQAGLFSSFGSSTSTPLIQRNRNVAARICETASHLAENDDDQSHLKTVVDELIYIATFMEDADHAKKIVDEWMFVSMIIDRVFLIIFAITCFVAEGMIKAAI